MGWNGSTGVERIANPLSHVAGVRGPGAVRTFTPATPFARRETDPKTGGVGITLSIEFEIEMALTCRRN